MICSKRYIINELSTQLKKIKKKSRINHKNKRKRVIKKEKENKHAVRKINKFRSWLFEEIYKTPQTSGEINQRKKQSK
jgi:hypothetical protein